jgi:hypothetical protein
MKRNIYFRLFIVVLVASMSVLLFSYVRARSTNSKSSDPCNESGKCGGTKARSEIILLESLTHNLLVSNR